MFRIDNPSAVPGLATVPGAGLPGYFTKGNPATGVSATIVDDWWLNMVQEEILTVITSAGLTPAKTDNTQLYQAIQHLVGPELFLPLTGGTLAGPGNLTVDGLLTVSGGTILHPASGQQVALEVDGNIQVNGTEVQGPTGGLNFYGGIIVQVMSGNLDAQWNYGNLRIYTGSGYQPGGGPWLASSDERVKKDIERYERGLEAIRNLHPVTYRYNGLGRSSDNGVIHHGLVAQDVLPVMPEMILEDNCKLNPDDAEDTSLYAMNCNALTFALVNAVQELAARLDALGG